MSEFITERNRRRVRKNLKSRLKFDLTPRAKIKTAVQIQAKPSQAPIWQQNRELQQLFTNTAGYAAGLHTYTVTQGQHMKPQHYLNNEKFTGRCLTVNILLNKPKDKCLSAKLYLGFSPKVSANFFQLVTAACWFSHFLPRPETPRNNCKCVYSIKSCLRKMHNQTYQRS